jgi:hypothetical protein
MNYGRVISATSGFYLGNILTVQNIDPISSYTYTHQVGFLMPYVIDLKSCVKPTYSSITQSHTLINSISYYSPGQT